MCRTITSSRPSTITSLLASAVSAIWSMACRWSNSARSSVVVALVTPVIATKYATANPTRHSFPIRNSLYTSWINARGALGIGIDLFDGAAIHNLDRVVGCGDRAGALVNSERSPLRYGDESLVAHCDVGRSPRSNVTHPIALPTDFQDSFVNGDSPGNGHLTVNA